MQFVKIMIMLAVLLAQISYFSYSGENNNMADDNQIAKLLAHMTSPDGPGIQYVVTGRAGILYEHSTGLADVGKNTPLSLNHAMAAFSMTKTLTAIAILQLLEQDMLEIDLPVSRYVKHPYDQDITIRQLMNHTSGIPNPIPLRWVHLAKDHLSFNESAALTSVLEQNPNLSNSPGTKYAYSNIDYWLLGNVIEAASGASYTSYIKTHIFERLGLSQDVMAFAYSTDGLHAKGYLAKYSFLNLIKRFVTDREVWGNYEGGWLHIKDVYVNGPAFGGSIGTARAFSVILRDLLAEQPVLLNDRGRELLFTRQKDRSGNEIDMTLGWHIGNLDGTRYYYKEGGGAGFHSEMRMYPSKGLATVIMSNQTTFNTRSEMSKLDRLFLKQ